jgi:hypothetical protein
MDDAATLHKDGYGILERACTALRTDIGSYVGGRLYGDCAESSSERPPNCDPRSVPNTSVRRDILDLNNHRLVRRYQACFQFLHPPRKSLSVHLRFLRPAPLGRF